MMPAEFQLPEGATLKGRPIVTHPDHVLVQGPSRHDGVTMCTAHLDEWVGVRVNRGCYSGDVAGFVTLAMRYARNRPDQIAQAQEYADAILAHPAFQGHFRG